MATSVQVRIETLLWVQVPSTAGSLVIPVAKEQVGAVIGSGGSVVKGLQETTGAQISIVEEEGNKPTVNVRLGLGDLRHGCMRQSTDLMRALIAGLWQHGTATVGLRGCDTPDHRWQISGYV